MKQRTKKYIMEFSSITEKDLFKSAAAKLGLTMNELLLNCIQPIIVKYNKGKLTKETFKENGK